MTNMAVEHIGMRNKSWTGAHTARDNHLRYLSEHAQREDPLATEIYVRFQ